MYTLHASYSLKFPTDSFSFNIQSSGSIQKYVHVHVSNQHTPIFLQAFVIYLSINALNNQGDITYLIIILAESFLSIPFIIMHALFPLGVALVTCSNQPSVPFSAKYLIMQVYSYYHTLGSNP